MIKTILCAASALTAVAAFGGLNPTAMASEGILSSTAADTAITTDAKNTVIYAGKAVAPDGSIIENVVVTIDDLTGKFKTINSGTDVPAVTRSSNAILKYENAVICPGLIDIGSSLGAYGNTIEQTYAIDPDLSVLDGFDPDSPNLATALHAGITATMLMPEPINLVCGTAATVHTWTETAGKTDVIRADGPLILALGPSTWDYSGEPSSRAGALHMLRQALTAESTENNERLTNLLQGKLDSLIWCAEAEDVSAANRLYSTRGITPIIAHTQDAVYVTEEMAEYKYPVVLGPYTFVTKPHILAGAGTLAKAGVEVAFRGDEPAAGPDSLRITATLAVKYGMTPEAARRAFTSTAAKIAGVSDRLGSLEAGKDADFVIFSGDPLKLESRVLEIWVGGKRVWYANSDNYKK